jgi:peptidoglycan/xylan/chitin deacetylase (PgdA/CDA1 family)
MSKLSVILLLALAVINSCSNRESLHGKTEITNWQDGKNAAVSITYDDATINQFRQALPIMDTLGFKGTFFINTVDIPGSKFLPRYFGRPLEVIVKESAVLPTNEANLFERASALRFLNVEGAVESHNSAGSLYEQGKPDEACKLVDLAFEKARKGNTGKPTAPPGAEVITWDEIRKFAANGHEFGNHTISHPRLAVLDEANLLYELEKCREEILNQLGKDHTFSAECPFGTEDERVMQYAYKIHPALRNRMPEPFLEELNRWNPDPPGVSEKPYVQWQRGPLQKNSLEEMKSWVDTLLRHDNVWLVLTFHGVDGIGWEPRPHGELKAYFTYMKQREDKLWIATFRDVTRYIREKMSADLVSRQDGGKFVITLKHALDKELYNFPLTLKTYVAPEWKKVSVVQGDKVLAINASTDEKGSYVLYQAVPNAGEITVGPAPQN